MRVQLLIFTLLMVQAELIRRCSNKSTTWGQDGAQDTLLQQYNRVDSQQLLTEYSLDIATEALEKLLEDCTGLYFRHWRNTIILKFLKDLDLTVSYIRLFFFSLGYFYQDCIPDDPTDRFCKASNGSSTDASITGCFPEHCRRRFCEASSFEKLFFQCSTIRNY